MIREPKNDTPIFNFTNILLIIMMAVVLLLIGIVYTTSNKTTKTTNEEDTTIVEQRRFTLVANPTKEVSENNTEEVKEETPVENEVNTNEFAICQYIANITT